MNEARLLKHCNGALSIRETAGDRTDLDDGSLGSTEKRQEGLTGADDRKEIGSEH